MLVCGTYSVQKMLSAITDKDEGKEVAFEKVIIKRNVRHSMASVGIDAVDSIQQASDLNILKTKEEEDPEEIKGTGQFQLKRLLVAGMMDVSLMTSNANQLKYILAHQLGSASTVICVVLISLSLFLQVCSGICFIYKVRKRVI